MFAGTHFCAPLLPALLVNLAAGLRNRAASPAAPPLGARHLWIIGLCGLLPDLVDPHIRLAARMSSWSHTLWFIVAAGPGLWLVFRMAGLSRPGLTAVFGWLGVALHVLGDMVSGGVAPLMPWRPDRIGAYHVHYRHWLTLDAAMIVLTIALGVAARIVAGRTAPPAERRPLPPLVGRER